MKTYTVLYAEDVPHYALGEVEARGPKDAIAKARKLDTETFTAYDPDWSGAICKRIVHIEDQNGEIIAEDIPLDSYYLSHGEPQRRLCEAAAAMLEALDAVDTLIRKHGIGDRDIESEPVVAKIAMARAKARGQQ